MVTFLPPSLHPLSAPALARTNSAASSRIRNLPSAPTSSLGLGQGVPQAQALGLQQSFARRLCGGLPTSHKVTPFSPLINLPPLSSLTKRTAQQRTMVRKRPCHASGGGESSASQGKCCCVCVLSLHLRTPDALRRLPRQTAGINLYLPCHDESCLPQRHTRVGACR